MTGKTAEYMTPEQYVASHEIAKELIRIDFRREDIPGIRFTDTNQQIPFDLWPVNFPADLRYECIPLIRAAAALRYAVVDNPPWSQHKEAAWRLVGRAMIAPLFRLAREYQISQSQKGRVLRGKILEDGTTIGGLIGFLALEPEHRDTAVKDLWNVLLGRLDENGLNPEEGPDRKNRECWVCEYDNLRGERKKISLRRFANIVAKARNSS
jgi:hypothetical protein